MRVLFPHMSRTRIHGSGSGNEVYYAPRLPNRGRTVGVRPREIHPNTAHTAPLLATNGIRLGKYQVREPNNAGALRSRESTHIPRFTSHWRKLADDMI